MKNKAYLLALTSFALVLPSMTFALKREDRGYYSERRAQSAKPTSVEIPATSVKETKKKEVCPAGSCKAKSYKPTEKEGPAFVKDNKDSPILPKSK